MMVLHWTFILLCIVNFCARNLKAGIPGIKIKAISTAKDSSDYTELSALIGSSIHLPCNLSQDSNEDGVKLVLWYKLDFPNPIYTLDIRTNTIEAKHYSSKIFGSRAYFNVTKHATAHLRINPLKDDDEGEYRCRIDYKRGRTINRIVKLNVIVPVKYVRIRGERNITYSGVIGPFSEGQKLTLICEATGGRPTPRVFWKKEQRELESTTYVDHNGMVMNIVVIDSLTREDLSTILTCHAMNNNITSPVFSSVMFNMNLKPLNVKITTHLEVLTNGDEIEISCQSEGSKPPAEIIWLRENDTVSPSSTHLYDHITISIMQMNVSADDNGRKITCKAQNPHLPESALQDSLTLFVQYAPRLSLVFGTNVQYEHIREGSDVYFECNVQSNPPISEIKWKFQSEDLYHEPLKGIMIKNHSLLLHNVSKKNRGMYQCLGENSFGEGKSEEIYLRIQYSPVCSTRQLRTYGIARHGRSNISCSVDADPNEVNFTWTFNGSKRRELPGASGHRTDRGAESIIEYQPLTVTDYGVIQCHAKNAIGNMVKPCIYNIVPSGPPPPLLNCTIFKSPNNSIHVFCSNGDLVLPKSYHLEIYNMEDEHLVTNISTAKDPNFLIKNLPAGSNFVFVIYSNSNKGRSESVVLTTTTTTSSEKHISPKKKFATNIFLLSSFVFLGTLAVFTIIAGITVLRNKPKGHNMKDKPADIKVSEQSTPRNNECGEENSYIYNSPNIQTDFLQLTKFPTADSLLSKHLENNYHQNIIEGNVMNHHLALVEAREDV
ncbi:nephrin-like [Parasteatoda tepidariorum]|uniref:nephrin-like n=1 Tax=Parasteatoda tepidariorum TaxID=114398 RepID=UPI0039BC3320